MLSWCMASHPNGITGYLRTNPNINDQLPPLELAIRQQFLSTMIPHPPSDLERELFSLPVSRGGRIFVLEPLLT